MFLQIISLMLTTRCRAKPQCYGFNKWKCAIMYQASMTKRMSLCTRAVQDDTELIAFP